MENKISISNLIIEKIEQREKESNKKYIAPQYKSIYAFFLAEDFRSVFGTNEVESEDIDILSSKDSIQLLTIFTEEPITVCFLDTQVGFTIKGYTASQKEVFSIQNIRTSFCNEIYLEDKTKHYSASMDNEVYTYTETSKTDTLYQGRLIPLNAKHGEFEIFEYSRDVPPVVKSESFLKRLYDNLMGDNYISVHTSRELVDRIDYVDDIFGVLITKSNELEKAKTLKKED